MKKEGNGREEMLLRIYNRQDRQTVMGILVDAGYTVRQVKKARGEKGATVDYYQAVSEEEGNADTSRGTRSH